MLLYQENVPLAKVHNLFGIFFVKSLVFFPVSKKRRNQGEVQRNLEVHRIGRWGILPKEGTALRDSLIQQMTGNMLAD